MGIYCTKQNKIYPHQFDMIRAQYIKDYNEIKDHMMIKCKEQSQNTRNIINEINDIYRILNDIQTSCKTSNAKVDKLQRKFMEYYLICDDRIITNDTIITNDILNL